MILDEGGRVASAPPAPRPSTRLELRLAAGPGRRTIVPYLKAELKTGTLRAILKDLGIAAEDLSRDKE
jgi:hypothetical protein